jgi:hypothetical protein
MFMFTEGEPQKTPEEIIASLKAEITSKDTMIAELKPKADASSQNFERLKKIEAEKKELEEKLAGGESPKTFDSGALKKEIDEKVDLRLAGYTPEMIAEIDAYAKGRGISISEAAKSPFIKEAVDSLQAKAKVAENIPAPSNKGPVIGGKSASEIFKGGDASQKQEAWELLTKKGVKTNE